MDELKILRKKEKVKLLSHVRLFVTPWAVAYQAFLSMGFSRQEYWSGLPFPIPGDIYIYMDTRPPDLPLEKPVCRSGSNS